MSEYGSPYRRLGGQILGWSAISDEGAIAGQDGNRYTFHRSEWKDRSIQPERGLRVDFLTDGNAAIEIYPSLEQSISFSGTSPFSKSELSPSSKKSRVIAGVLAIVLGYFGIHKFYLRYTVPGLIMCFLGIVSVVSASIGLGVIIWLALVIVSIVEAVAYLTKSDHEFHKTYVANRKLWF